MVVGGRFVIEELAGSGGMGAVFRARDQHNEERVAVKILHPTMQVHMARFAREARLLAQLDHPGIVRYIAHGETTPLYLAMEWLEGEDLGQRLGRSPLGVREALTMARRVAEALEAAHRRGVVHRDIKPGNIFLVGGSTSSVKLLDFGVARPVGGPSGAMTVSGQILGTVGYMAPEQAREGADVRAPMDVFSLGCVLFECIGGAPAFPGAGLMPVLAKLLFSEIPRVSDVREDVPESLDGLLRRMMSRRAEDRPTMDAVIAELEAMVSSPAIIELEQRPRRIRPEGRASAIGDEEQPLVAIVMARPLRQPDSAAPTRELASVHSAAQALADALAPFGGMPDAQADGAFAVVLRDAASATDLAARAARCALILRQHMPALALSVALGRGDPWRPRAGLVAARAQRMIELSTAPGGRPKEARPRLRVDAATAALLDGRFTIEPDADSAELIAFDPAADPSRRPSAPFVGRTRELAMLEAALDECTAEPVATAVVVTGPAGIGKSRLWRELAPRLERFTVWRAAGDPDTPGRAGVVALQLGGAPGFVERARAACPLVVVIEDLQWADSTSLRVLDDALRVLHDQPFAVVGLGRPEVNDQFKELWSERRVQSVRLAPLMPRAARDLATALGAPAAQLDAIVDAAAGNPLDIEELAHGGFEVPQSLRALAQARIEQLEPRARRVLRAASVFGASFWTGGVVALLGDEARDEVHAVLHELAHRDLVVRRPTSRLRDQEELAFRTAALREAAYGMLTDRDRRLGHELAGAWLETAGERDPSVIAGHLERGGEPGGAVVWCLWAAEQALDEHRFDDAIRHARRGISNGATGPVHGELLLIEAEALGWCGRNVDHVRVAAEALALLPAGTSAHARAASELALAACRLGDHDRLAGAAQALTEPGPTVLGAAHAMGIVSTAISLLIAGRPDLAAAPARLLENATAAFPEDAAMLETARAWHAASRELFTGRPERHAREGLLIAGELEAAGHPRRAILAELHTALAYWALGANDRAIELAEPAVARAEQLGLVPYVARARAHLPLLLAERGNTAESEAVVQACLDASLASGDRLTQGRAAASLAMIALLRGDAARAVTIARDTLARPDLPADGRRDSLVALLRGLTATGNSRWRHRSSTSSKPSPNSPAPSAMRMRSRTGWKTPGVRTRTGSNEPASTTSSPTSAAPVPACCSRPTPTRSASWCAASPTTASSTSRCGTPTGWVDRPAGSSRSGNLP
jgi:hypothetical protein